MPLDEDSPCHEGSIDLGAPQPTNAPAGTGALTARFVRYPGSQQLQVWLPSPGAAGYTGWRRCAADGRVAEQGAVADVLSGPVQMLFDTLAWPPGAWRLEVQHADGWHQTLPMVKHPEGAAAAPQGHTAPAGTPAGGSSAPVYRDGFGRVIPDAERQVREQALAQLVERFARRIRYDGNGRAGTYTWAEDERRIRFDQEMGASPCRAWVRVPEAARWEAETGLPLARRDEVLQRLAEQARSDFGARFSIHDDAIRVY